MLKFVYVLISSDSDYYAEQAALSMYSLLLHNPGSHIVLVSDEDTLKSLTDGRSLIKDYVSEYITVNPPVEFTPQQRSRFLKTTLRQNIKGDFLFLDCDTIVTGSLQELESFDCDVAAVYAQHSNSREVYSCHKGHWDNNNQHWSLTKYYKIRKVPNDEKYDIPFHCNSGVMLCRDTEKAHQLFETWHKFWLESSTQYGYNLDQCDLWRANAMHGGILTELNGVYNCQIIYTVIALRYLFDCKILHYFSTSESYCNISFKKPDVLAKVRKYGITPDVKDRILSAKDEYIDNIVILKGKQLESYYSTLVQLAIKVYKKYPFVNNAIKNICKIHYSVAYYIHQLRRYCTNLYKCLCLPIKLDIHAVEHCNLNCSGCTHYSPLSAPEFCDPEQLNRSLQFLLRFQKSFGAVQILGGEPLLNPNLAEIIEIVRKNFPKTQINLLTNGLLLLQPDKLPNRFWETCRENNIVIKLTRYPINFDYAAAERISKQHNVQFVFFSDRSETSRGWTLFHLHRNGNNSKAYKYGVFKLMKCPSINCYQLVENRIYPCSHSAYVRHLNRAFNTDFKHTDRDYIEVDKIKNSFQIRKLMLFATPFCLYCGNYTHTKWAVSRRSADEWITY